MSSIQASVGKSKQEHPERYCPSTKCLWRVLDRDGNYIGPCGRHGDLRPREQKCQTP